MNVRIADKRQPRKTTLYSGIVRVAFTLDGWITVFSLNNSFTVHRDECGRIDIDNDPGDWWS